jgi:AraC-like DNA-binding protein
MKLSKMQLYRKLKALTGMSPTLVVRDLRLTEASKLIRKGELNVSEVAYEVGFTDPSYFTRAFKEKFDTAPSQYK